MNTAPPAATALRIMAVLVLVVVLVGPLPFLRSTHLTFSDVHVTGNDVTAFATQDTISYAKALAADRGELAWIVLAALGAVALAWESIDYKRAIVARRKAGAIGAGARFALLAAAGGAAAAFAYPFSSDDVAPAVGAQLVVAAAALLVLNALSELAACARGQRGWTAPLPTV